MRRLMLLIAAGILWLFLAAVPVFADGGPHVASVNSGVSSLTADSCAGCHRAHTAQGAMLLNAPTEEELCLTCHGAASTGATTDVMTGIQYALGDQRPPRTMPPSGRAPRRRLRPGPLMPATDPASPTRGHGDHRAAPSRRSKVAVAAARANVTSAHIADGRERPDAARHVAWGNGANGSGAGPAATVGCASCHNPHGNGQYRILNPDPEPRGRGRQASRRRLPGHRSTRPGAPCFDDRVYTDDARTASSSATSSPSRATGATNGANVRAAAARRRHGLRPTTASRSRA